MTTIYTYNGQVLTEASTGKWLAEKPDPFNPLNLPANTVRVRTSDGNVPDTQYSNYDTATLVPGTSDVYDVYKSGTDFSDLLYLSTNVIEVLGANTTGITNMSRMFMSCVDLATVQLFDTSKVTNTDGMFSVCSSLITVPLYDTSNVTNMDGMFSSCESLTSVPLFDTSNVTSMQGTFVSCESLTVIPLFDTSKVTNMVYTFMSCRNVKSGALALYQQASSQANPPVTHVQAFRDCGKNTTTGAAELAQIPSDWK